MKRTEEQECIALNDWARYHPICKHYLVHIPNGGTRHLLEAMKLKRMGVRAGVSDYLLAYPTSKHKGLWIEMKSKNGKLTEQQANWLKLMKDIGHDTLVAYSFEEARDYIVNEYLK